MVHKQLFYVGYTDETGVKELLEKAEGELAGLELVKERKLMRRFMSEVVKSGQGLATYGEAQVRKALEAGAVDTLLLSETLRKSRVEHLCPNCGTRREATVPAGEEDAPAACPKCGAAMRKEKSTELIRDLADRASKFGTKVALISVESDDGKMFLAAFAGLGATLRFLV